MGWTCWKCKAWCELTGVLGLAAIMTPDPESSVALSAIKATYTLLVKKYGREISEEDFIENTKNLLGIMEDFEFIAAYPGKVCQWFNKC